MCSFRVQPNVVLITQRELHFPADVTTPPYTNRIQFDLKRTKIQLLMMTSHISCKLAEIGTRLQYCSVNSGVPLSTMIVSLWQHHPSQFVNELSTFKPLIQFYIKTTLGNGLRKFCFCYFEISSSFIFLHEFIFKISRQFFYNINLTLRFLIKFLKSIFTTKISV